MLAYAAQQTTGQSVALQPVSYSHGFSRQCVRRQCTAAIYADFAAVLTPRGDLTIVRRQRVQM